MSEKRSPARKNLSQSVRIGDISRSHVKISQKQTADYNVPRNSVEFIGEIKEIIKALDDSLEASEAKEELRKAIHEAEAEQPSASKIRRFLYGAKGLLESVAQFQAIVEILGKLASKVPSIF